MSPDKWSVKKDEGGMWWALCIVTRRTCRCKKFPTHAEAIAYADCQARKDQP